MVGLLKGGNNEENSALASFGRCISGAFKRNVDVQNTQPPRRDPKEKLTTSDKNLFRQIFNQENKK